ncbi:MAG: alkaline phosphatase family protein [Victivallales bacterium]|nr:alkaline phosphatase family protein [Victivallales bacterium]
MEKHVTIFMFIDALGWEIVSNHDFCAQKLPFRYPVKMQLGYSSTAVPTILSGRKPVEHKHFSFYYYSPATSPFRIFKYLPLQYLPSGIFDRWRVRHLLSVIIRKIHGFTGYFELYNMPYNRLPFFDYCEKKDIFAAGGLPPVKNLRDVLDESKISYLISDWRQSDSFNIAQMKAALKRNEIEFGFLYTGRLDGFLHSNIPDADAVAGEISKYEKNVEDLYQILHDNYRDFTFTVISDHGMTPLRGISDLKAQIDRLDLSFGKDYAAVFDSTLARFWFFNPAARKKIMQVLETQKNARLLTPADKRKYGIDFKDNMFGEEILLCAPGIQIVPSDMGRSALPGMHGYAPEDKDSYACLLSNKAVSHPPGWVGDYFKLMVEQLQDRAS